MAVLGVVPSSFSPTTQLWLMGLHLAQHGMHSHLHLWEAIQSTWREKGSALHLVVRKVKGHRTAAKCHGDPMLLLEKRLNDGADKLAVVAAERHQVPVALPTPTSCNGEWKRIWPLQQTWLNIHMARETVIRIRNLDGIHNSSSTEVAPTPAPRVSQPEVPRQLGCLDGTSPAEEQPPAMFPRYSWDPLPYDHFKHFRGNISITAGTLAKDTPGLLKDWSWYPPALFDLLLWSWRQLEWSSLPRATSPNETVNGWIVPLTSEHLVM